MFAVDQVIHIEEIPTWLFIPFGVVLAGVLAWTVRWILKGPAPR